MIAGSIDVDAADKAAHFVQVCDSFHLPLVFMTDNPGVLAEYAPGIQHLIEGFYPKRQKRLQDKLERIVAPAAQTPLTKEELEDHHDSLLADLSELSEKLVAECVPTEWAMLAMHQRRGAFFMVDLQLKLIDVAPAVAQDQADDVRGWIEAGLLLRPTEAEIDLWDREDGARFMSVIVQPHVLAQRAPHDA